MRSQFGVIFYLCIFALFSIAAARVSDEKEAASDKELKEGLRKQKLFSLFSIVTFPNTGCASQDASRNGTCYTSSECKDKGGTSSGNCAVGFGVCCLFIVKDTSTTINENCTYIQNPSFPSAYTDTTALTYTINKCSGNVCAVRLDFETFTTAGPTSTAEVNGGACTDSLVVSGTSGLSSPVICGTNAGQHIYMEMGNSGSSDTATLAFTFSGASTIRTWELKATQIPCGADYKPPDGCLQYHTTLSGRFQTFNFAETTTPMHLASQNYAICIRREEGYCCVEYSLCDGATSSYGLSSLHASQAMQDDLCTEDWVGIDGVSASCSTSSGTVTKDRLCGATGILNIQTAQTVTMNSVCDCVPPFNVQIYTEATAGIATQAQKGLCFEYKQIPCSSVA